MSLNPTPLQTPDVPALSTSLSYFFTQPFLVGLTASLISTFISEYRHRRSTPPQAQCLSETHRAIRNAVEGALLGIIQKDEQYAEVNVTMRAPLPDGRGLCLAVRATFEDGEGTVHEESQEGDSSGGIKERSAEEEKVSKGRGWKNDIGWVEQPRTFWLEGQ